jgi:hypothetical protein
MSKLKVGMKLHSTKTNNNYTVKQISISHNKAYLQQDNNTIDISESHNLSKVEELLQTGYYTIIEDTKQHTLYWYSDSKTEQRVLPEFTTLKQLTDYNKAHRKYPKNTSILIINSKEYDVYRCQNKPQKYRGMSRF